MHLKARSTMPSLLVDDAKYQIATNTNGARIDAKLKWKAQLSMGALYVQCEIVHVQPDE